MRMHLFYIIFKEIVKKWHNNFLDIFICGLDNLLEVLLFSHYYSICLH